MMRDEVAAARSRLSRFRSIHVVGAGGAGMSGLAKLLAQRGHDVTGSDLKPGPMLDALADAGVETWIGHRPERAGEWDLVVASSAVPARDAELQAAAAHDTPVWERPSLLEALTADQPATGFSGTHGKTTSTALAVAAFRGMGEDPSFLLGGELADLNTGAHLGEGERFLLEADEAFGTFLRLHLEGLVVTNVEADHLDYYPSLAALHDAFVDVVRRVDGPVVVCLDDPGSARLRGAGSVSYGMDPGARWRIRNLRHGDWDVEFELDGPEGSLPVRVPRPGEHLARNAAGVLALVGELGLDVARAAAGIAAYGGVRRRFEVRARIGGVTLVDDYAHHPTEVAATVAAGRRAGCERVWAVFQPHRYTRTAELGHEFGPALAGADRVVVTDVYPAGEEPIPGVSGRLVHTAVERAGGRSHYVPSLREVPGWLAGRLAPGDLVLLLGAGDIPIIADEIAVGLGS